MKRLIIAATGAALALSGGLLTSPANAAPLVTGGLVNVIVGDVTILEDVNVGAALGVAANICDVNVNVLARQLRNEAATCTAAADGQTVTIE